MAGPGEYVLREYRGDSFELTVSLKDANGNPYNLTGSTAAAKARVTADGDLAVEFIVSVPDPVAGTLVLTLPPDGVLPSRGLWDLQVTNSVGLVRTLLAGAVYTTADVTHDEVVPV